jgi:hypothetical protein
MMLFWGFNEAFGSFQSGAKWLDDYATPAFNTGSEYHSPKELVNAVAAGRIYLHFA